MNKMKKSITVLTSIATTLSLSGVAMLAPMAALAVDVVDGDLIRNPSAEGLAQLDIYIVKVVGTEKYKRLILSPHVFESYAHFDKNGNGNNWDDVMDVGQSTMDEFTTSDLVRVDGTDQVYRLHAADGTDTGDKYWLNMTATAFTAVFDADSIYTINSTDSAGYTAGSNVTDASATFPPVSSGTTSEGTLSVSLAADTPASGVVVENAARVYFTKINLTASGGDVIVDQVVTERTGLAQDAAITSLDLIDGDTGLPINVNSKTLNSIHRSTFNEDFTVANGTTKPIIIAVNMPSSLDSYNGEAPSFSLAAITVKGDASVNASLPITGNQMTLNSTITIGTATIQRGAYTNATSTSIQVGKEDYTFFSFQIQAGSAEKVKFSQIKVYQEGSASLGTDVINLELLQDGTKIADGIIASSKYANFSFDEITIDKGQTLQYQVRADIEDGSARTIDMGIYRTTDLLVKGVTYGYNITPSYSSTGSSGNNPVMSDNLFTISNGTLQVTRSNSVGAENVGVANDQYLGAFTFTCKGEQIDISALTLTIASTGTGSQIEDALTGLELVDPNGVVVAGPTDITNDLLTVAWTDTFTVPVGETIYKVRGDLATNGGWASDDTIVVSFTPSDTTAQGETTGNSITATPASSVSGNTQTVKAAALTITRNTLPANSNIIVDQKDVNLSSWSFDATDSGEDIRITSIGFTAKASGMAATNTNALTVWADDVAQSPVNDAVADSDSGTAASSTFALEEPIIIAKGTTMTIELHGDKDTVASDDTENWGLRGDSVTAYGVNTGNTVTETLTQDDGPTLTSVVNGTLTIETESNPSSAIVLAGSTGNVFSNVKLTAEYEDLRLDRLIVYVADGSYTFTPGAGEYRDFTNVSIYDGTTKLAESSISSDNTHTFNFNAGDLTVPSGGSKTLVIKADMSTVDKTNDNAPGTNSADVKLGFGGVNGIKTTGMSSNAEITTSTYEVYRSSTSSALVLRSSLPIVTLPTADNRLGAASSLTSDDAIVYAFKVSADASGGEVLMYRVTFGFATSGSGVVVGNIRIRDDSSNTLKTSTAPVQVDGEAEVYFTTTFDSPDVDNGAAGEAVKIDAGESKTFYVYADISGADAAADKLTVRLIGDTASTSAHVNTDNNADAFGTPNYDFTTDVGNFIWSDNYKQANISGTGTNNATTQVMWYNGHLVSGLDNLVSTTPYTLSY